MLIMGPNGEEIAAVHSGQPDGTRPDRNIGHDNARLIAAAPRLLAERNALLKACKQAVSVIPLEFCGPLKVIIANCENDEVAR